MKRQLIEEFLNLPAIAGIALIDGQSRSVVHGLSQWNHSEVTGEIQQILETAPDGLESLTFCFENNYVLLHRVDRGMALLVLAQPPLPAAYAKLIAQITRFMRTDFEAVATALAERLSAPAAFAPRDAAQAPELAPTVTAEEVAIALNQLSQFTTRYLGKFIVANHWRNSCPPSEGLKRFQVTTMGTIELASAPGQPDTVTPQQLAAVRIWVAAFAQRCAKIIRDYTSLVQAQALDQRQWQLLFGASAPSPPDPPLLADPPNS